MPLYTYRCSDCERQIEKLRAVEHRDEPEPCECGEQMEKVPSQTAEPKIVGGTERFYE